MKKGTGIAIVLIIVVFIMGVSGCSNKVSYEIVTSLPADYPLVDMQRDRNNPVTAYVIEEYIAVLPPYGYEVELIDVVRDAGIVMLYNLVKLEDPNGEAPVFIVKVSNPRGIPLGAFCQNLDILG